jgi:molybdate transport repressor ModE-like protein
MNSNDLNLRLLRSFLTVVECGKVSTAAKQLHLSQPAVTAHVRRLEEIVGRPLISRSRRGVRLTTHGHTLRTLLAEIQNTLSRIEASFRTEQKLRIIVDTVSAMVTPGKGLLAMDESNRTCNKRLDSRRPDSDFEGDRTES